MIDSNGRLLVFEDFMEDRGLPKFAVAEEEYGRGGIYVSNNSQTVMVQRLVPRASWFARLLRWLRLKAPERGMSVRDFFASVHNSMQEIETVTERAEGYERALLLAKANGQTALFDQLTAGLNSHRMEAQLLALEMPQFLEEETLVRFYKQSKRGLRLDWLRHFTRQIPSEVTARKARADRIGIFDNYVVLHYDPKEKSWAETAKEREARKDPILFGLMKGRRRLYYVGDWIDEYCDLTLDQIADTMGSDAIGRLEGAKLLGPYRAVNRAG
jgi:hypothetical protein